jgi:hypothetical protein
MIHPLKLQRSNMIAYEQIDKDGNHIIIDGKSQMPDYLSEKFLLEEYQEKIQAESDLKIIESIKDVLSQNYYFKIIEVGELLHADALGDILICTAGAGIQHKISLEDFPEHFHKNQWEVSPTDNKVDILKTVELIQNDLSSKHATAQKLHLIWNTIIIEAKEHCFDIEGIYNAIAENNLARIIYDENGKPKRNSETNKIMRKDMHPDLTPFIL